MMRFNLFSLILLLLSLLLLCAIKGTVLGDEGVNPSKEGTKTGSIVQKQVDEFTPKEYMIQLAVKFYHILTGRAGDIILDRDWIQGGTTHKKGTMFPIEDVLKMANGIQEVESNLQDMKNREGGSNDQLRFGPILLFHEKIEKIKIVKKDGSEEEMEFKIDAGAMELTSFVDRLAAADWRWHPFLGKCSGKEEYVFRLRNYDGHAMVTLSETVPKTAQNPGGGYFEVARFHMLENGLYLFKKWAYNEEMEQWGKDFRVFPDAEMTEQYFSTSNNRSPGTYIKMGFPPAGNLFTKKLSIAQMKAMALKIIGGRKSGGDFRCRHFAYQFVRSIVPDKSLASLSHTESWPENLRTLDQNYKNHDDGSYAFGICKNFDYKDWVRNHLDRDGNVKEGQGAHHQRQDINSVPSRGRKTTNVFPVLPGFPRIFASRHLLHLQ